MLKTPCFHGQGLGNFLHNYVTVRSLAEDNGYNFGVIFPERFKGKDFMKLYMGSDSGKTTFLTEGHPPTTIEDGYTYYREQGDGDYDQYLLNDLPDNLILHGNLQGEDYFKHNKDDIREWLSVEPLDLPHDLCIIGFRGGEYKYVPEFFLPKSYFEEGIKMMLEINPNMRFEVHTDDVEAAKKYFPDYNCIHDIGLNWRSFRYARYLIISNSSFSWLPAWLNQNVKLIIAPKFWGRRNVGYWFLKQNYTQGFKYI